MQELGVRPDVVGNLASAVTNLRGAATEKLHGDTAGALSKL